MQPVPGQGMPSMPDQQQPAPAHSAAAMTMVPQAADRPRARASKAVPIFLGITALVLVGGAVAAFAFLGGDDPASGATAAGSGTAVTVPVPTAPAATDTPSSTGSAPATTSATATAEAAPAEVQITIACKPGCDSVQIDGKAVEEITKPAKVTAGKHTLTAAKEGYTSFEETVEVEINGASAKVTFTKEGSPAQTAEVKDLSKPLEHKVALALAPAAKSTGASTSTAPTSTGTRTSTGTKTKPGCKSKFGVGCK